MERVFVRVLMGRGVNAIKHGKVFRQLHICNLVCGFTLNAIKYLNAQSINCVSTPQRNAALHLFLPGMPFLFPFFALLQIIFRTGLCGRQQCQWKNIFNLKCFSHLVQRSDIPCVDLIVVQRRCA